MDRGEITPAENGGSGRLGEFYNKLVQQSEAVLDSPEMTRRSFLGISILGVLGAGVAAAKARNGLPTLETIGSNLLQFAQSQSPEADVATAAEVPADATADPVLETTTTTVPPRPAEKLGLSIDPRVEQAMHGMRLTPEGYANFLASLDTTKLPNTQIFREFNPAKIISDILQGPSEIFVLHFTVKYANEGLGPEFNDHMIGNFDVLKLVSGMAGRNGHGGQCCGINWMIGRHGNTYQTAPLNAKLNHNPPYDSISTGVEIEAGEQAAITTAQYEPAAYLAIAVLDTQNRLGKFPLQDILKGHGEMRDAIIDEWNASHPNQKLGVRDDFNAPETKLFRYYVQEFLDRHPEIIGTRPLAGLA